MERNALTKCYPLIQQKVLFRIYLEMFLVYGPSTEFGGTSMGHPHSISMDPPGKHRPILRTCQSVKFST